MPYTSRFAGLPITDSVPRTPKGLSRGRIPRDYKEHPLGSYAGVSVFGDVLDVIPRSQWAQMLEAQEAAKSTLLDLRKSRGIQSLNQNGTSYCHDDKTEVLTDVGWKSWSSYDGSDLLGTMDPATGMLEFQAPTHLHAYEYHGELMHSVNRCIDFGVTPDHRMLVRKWNEQSRTLSDQFSFTLAKDLGWYVGLPHATRGHRGIEISEVEVGGRKYSGDDFIQLLSLVISDGFAGASEKSWNTVSFCAFKPERRAVVAPLAERLGFKEQPGRPGVWSLHCLHELAAWIRANCYSGSPIGATTKCVPAFIKSASERQIRLFLDMYGDKTHTKTEGREFFSASRRLIDDLQELLLRIGKRGSIFTRPASETEFNGKPIYSKESFWLHERAVDRLCIDRKKHLVQDHYHGAVYCATVPNGTLVTRRNGSILVSGNCWINAPTQAIHYVRARMGQRKVLFSPASAGAPIKGFRNVGGWGTQGAEWIAEHGICPQEVWPANAISRQYYTEENKKIAAKYRITDWCELKPRSFDELATCLLLGLPVAIGLNWWSHEVLAVNLVAKGGKWFVAIDNSWGSGYGDNGIGLLTEVKGRPDDSVCLRLMTAA